MKRKNALTKALTQGVLILSLFCMPMMAMAFEGGAGPDAGYTVGGSMRDLEVFKKQKRELISDVTKLPGFKVVMKQLSELYSYAPYIGSRLESALTNKNWYFAEFPVGDTTIAAERIGRQDDNNIYLSKIYNILKCESTCTEEEENKIRLQGELIYHELWVSIARGDWNKVEAGHPNQDDVENVVGALLAQGKDYRASLNAQGALLTLLSEFNFLIADYSTDLRQNQIPLLVKYLKDQGIQMQIRYKAGKGMEMSYQTHDPDFIPQFDEGLYYGIHSKNALGRWWSGSKYKFRTSPRWKMCGYTTAEYTSTPGPENTSNVFSVTITCIPNGHVAFDMDASGNILIP